MKCDTVTLAKVIDQCFDYSMDGRIPPPQQTEFLALGKKLRGCFINLVSAQFDNGTTTVTNANTALQSINQTLSNETTTLNNIASTVNNIATLAATLDQLLSIAKSFV